jgi:hypothetical protein
VQERRDEAAREQLDAEKRGRAAKEPVVGERGARFHSIPPSDE